MLWEIEGIYEVNVVIYVQLHSLHKFYLILLCQKRWVRTKNASRRVPQQVGIYFSWGHVISISITCPLQKNEQAKIQERLQDKVDEGLEVSYTELNWTQNFHLPLLCVTDKRHPRQRKGCLYNSLLSKRWVCLWIYRQAHNKKGCNWAREALFGKASHWLLYVLLCSQREEVVVSVL